jgi:hypothetical protein
MNVAIQSIAHGSMRAAEGMPVAVSERSMHLGSV